VIQNLDDGKETDVLIMVFSKAFDKVSHNLLMHKQEHYGIRGMINNWMESVLSGRTQAVIVEGEQSTYLPVDSGVPLGSTLGPSLFLYYINDIARLSHLRSSLIVTPILFTLSTDSKT
jgi:hypothetical protein